MMHPPGTVESTVPFQAVAAPWFLEISEWIFPEFFPQVCFGFPFHFWTVFQFGKDRIMLNRVAFNLPTFTIQDDLMVQEVFGYYTHAGIKLSVHLFRFNSVLESKWMIQVYGDHFVFADRLAQINLPGDTELYTVLQKANDLTVETAKARLVVAA